MDKKMKRVLIVGSMSHISLLQAIQSPDVQTVVIYPEEIDKEDIKKLGEVIKHIEIKPIPTPTFELSALDKKQYQPADDRGVIPSSYKKKHQRRK
jgi:hypothetical protein